MASYSQEFLRAVVDQFNIPSISSLYNDIVPFGNGHINHTFMVSYNSPDVIGKAERKLLQMINTQIFKDVDGLTSNIKHVCDHLNSKGITTIDMISLKSSASRYIYHELTSESYWRMFEFVPNSRSVGDVPSIEDAYQAAWQFGRFQYHLQDMPVDRLTDTIPNFHNTRLRYKELLHAIENDRIQRVATYQLQETLIPYVTSREDRLTDALWQLHTHHNVPIRIVHNDTKLNNVLLHVTTGEGICVVDLDTVMPGLSLYDFGDMIRTAANTCPEDHADTSEVDINLSVFEAVVRGYLASGMLPNHDSRHGLLPIEMDHLVTAAMVRTGGGG